MAKLTLDAQEVTRELKPLLEQYLSDVKIAIAGDRAVLSGKKMFIKAEISIACSMEAPSHIVTLDLRCNSAATMALTSMGAAIRNGRPYIKSIDANACVIDLDEVQIGDQALTDFIQLQAIQLPAADGLFAAIEFTFKRPV